MEGSKITAFTDRLGREVNNGNKRRGDHQLRLRVLAENRCAMIRLLCDTCEEAYILWAEDLAAGFHAEVFKRSHGRISELDRAISIAIRGL